MIPIVWASVNVSLSTASLYVSGFAKRDLLGLCKRISTGVNSREIEISRKCGLLHHYNL